MAPVACGDDSTPTASTPGGGGGGSGGATVAGPSVKPVCQDPGQPASATPAVRADSAGALSVDGSSFVMFGGDVANVVCPNIPPKMPVDETWILDVACGQWRQLPVVGPSARSRHSIAGDHERGRALVFGGRWRSDPTMGSYTLYNDVWAFDWSTETWTQLATTGTPPEPRYNASVVIAQNEMIVFGGGTATSPVQFSPVNTTFALDLDTNEWREVVTQGGPPAPRLFHSAAYADVDNRMFIGYGSDDTAFTTTNFMQDQWLLDLATSTWHEVQIAEPPEVPYGRIKGGMFFRPSADGAEPHRLYMFAGHDDAGPEDGNALGNRNDVLAADIPVGAAADGLGSLQALLVRPGDIRLSSANGQCDFPADFVDYDYDSPERRSAFAYSSHMGGEAFVVFGGDSDCDRLSDSWWFDTRAEEWTKIRESLPGLTCPRTNGGDLIACAGMCG